MPNALFEELYTARITYEDKQQTIKLMASKMMVKWDPTTEFNKYTNLQEHYRYVTLKCNDQASGNAMVRQSLPSMEAIPDLEPACREWKQKPPANQTWDEFKTHFAREIRDVRRQTGSVQKLGLANEVQELKQKLEQRDQKIKLMCQAVTEGLQEMANATQEETAKPEPSNTTESDIKNRVKRILDKHTIKSPPERPTNKQQKRKGKNNKALYTSPDKTEGAVGVKVNGHDNWTATIMNTHKNVNAKEERIWCKPCAKWILQTYTEHWTGTHDAWAEKQKARLQQEYEEKLKNLK